MSPSIDLIRESVQQLPTTKLTFGEFKEGKPAIFAGSEPILLTRHAGIGQAYAELIVAVFPHLPQLLQQSDFVAATAVPEGSGLTSAPGLAAGVEGPVRAQIEAIVSLQPGMKDKCQLFSKLVFSAVAPFLSTAPVDQDSSRVEVLHKPSDQQVKEIRAGAVSDFIDWLNESGLNQGSAEMDLEDAFGRWVGEQNV